MCTYTECGQTHASISVNCNTHLHASCPFDGIPEGEVAPRVQRCVPRAQPSRGHRRSHACVPWRLQCDRAALNRAAAAEL